MSWSYAEDLVALRSGLANALALADLPTDAELVERVAQLHEAAGQGPTSEEAWIRYIERLRAQQITSGDRHKAQVRAALDARIRWREAERKRQAELAERALKAEPVEDDEELDV